MIAPTQAPFQSASLYIGDLHPEVTEVRIITLLHYITLMEFIINNIIIYNLIGSSFRIV